MNTSENLEMFILKKLEKVTKFYQNLIDINVYRKKHTTFHQYGIESNDPLKFSMILTKD